MPQIRMIAACLASAALVACGNEREPEQNVASGPVEEAPAVSLVKPDGTIIGSVRGGDSNEGAIFQVRAEGLPPGVHGMHLHMVGRCEGPAFESAGPHWNPTNAQHGLENPQGPHYGDLPNITVGEDGRFEGTVTIRNSYFAESRTRRGPSEPILDLDGSALVIHADPDDNRTDPSGNSGARIACAPLNR